MNSCYYFKVKAFIFLFAIVVFHFGCMPSSRTSSGVGPVGTGSDSRVLGVYAEKNKNFTLVIQKAAGDTKMPIRFALKKGGSSCSIPYENKPHLCALNQDFDGEVAFSGVLNNDITKVRGDLVWQNRKIGAIGPLNEIIASKTDTTTMVVMCTGPFGCCDLNLKSDSVSLSFINSDTECKADSTSSISSTSSSGSDYNTSGNSSSSSSSSFSTISNPNTDTNASSSISSSSSSSSSSGSSSFDPDPEPESEVEVKESARGMLKEAKNFLSLVSSEVSGKAQTMENIDRLRDGNAKSEDAWCSLCCIVEGRLDDAESSAEAGQVPLLNQSKTMVRQACDEQGCSSSCDL